MPAVARIPTTLELDARARAAGNDPQSAIVLAEVLLARPWSAQIARVTVDRAGNHRIAGITLSGVKLKRAIDPARFLHEANAIVDLALAADSGLEEVDLWTVVPPSAIPGRIPLGDIEAQATSRTVFTLTVTRRARAVREPYWNPAWRAGLAAQAANRSRVVR